MIYVSKTFDRLRRKCGALIEDLHAVKCPKEAKRLYKRVRKLTGDMRQEVHPDGHIDYAAAADRYLSDARILALRCGADIWDGEVSS